MQREILNKIESMKKSAERLLVKETHDRLDEIQNDITSGYITACDEVKEFIIADQKEPCEYCKDNPCWQCEYAGECRTWRHCKENNRADYKARTNYCHVCGRKLTK